MTSIELVLSEMGVSSGFVKLSEQTHVKWFGDSGNLVVLSEFPGGPGQVVIAAQDLATLRDFLLTVLPPAQFVEPELPKSEVNAKRK